jgi:hypothetical protein
MGQKLGRCQTSEANEKIPLVDIPTRSQFATFLNAAHPLYTKEHKKGKSGNRITLKTNHLNLTNCPDWNLHQYHVDFSPKEYRTVVRRAMLKEHAYKIGLYLYDGASTLYTQQEIDSSALVVKSTRREDDMTTIITFEVRMTFNCAVLIIIQSFVLSKSHVMLREIMHIWRCSIY